MKINERAALDFIGLSEGGYVNHPKDPGGATDRGITQATYDAWNRSKRRPLKPVRGISKEEAEQIIVANYFTPVRFNDLPSGLDLAVADYAVNSGPQKAIMELQRVIGVADDGNFGPLTMVAVLRADPRQTIIGLCARRLAFMRRLSTWPTFGKGWTKRVAAVEQKAFDMAGTAPRAPEPASAPAAPSRGIFSAILAALAALFRKGA
jgi:lysozyme family protein